MQHSSNETGRTGTQRTGDDGRTAAPRTETSRRSFLAATGAAVGLGGVASATAAANDEVTITSEFATDEIDVGETTEIEFWIDEIPADGVAGVTLIVDLDSEVAEFTGEISTTADWSEINIDLTDNGDESEATISTLDLQDDVAAGDQNVHLGAAEVEAVGEGSTNADLSLRNFTTDEDEDVPGTLSSDSLTVGSDGGGDGGLPPADDDGGSDDGSGGGDDSDGGSDDGSEDDGSEDDGMVDEDPVPGDSGEAGDDSEGGDSDDSGSDGGSDGGSGDGGSDGDDETPGFGVLATGAALLTAAGARLALDDADEQ